jgi:hypothetical protein
MAALSRTLGARDRSYHAVAKGDGFAFENPAQHLQIRFGSAGVAVASGSLRVSLVLQDSRTSRPAVGAAPRARANRVSFARRSLTEWYENGPLGLEQGFTVPRALSRGGSPLTLAIGV